MATSSVSIPVEEYLSTSYRPDCDYIDGEVRERNMGELPHSKLQMYLGWFFRNQRNDWRIEPLSEQRVQVSASRYRKPGDGHSASPSYRHYRVSGRNLRRARLDEQMSLVVAR
jgi:hypothetical protein